MGCATSKLDDPPAVALCREQCAFLDEAIHQRYALAEAHAAYIHSLRDVGHTLYRFFDQDLSGASPGPPSPLLNLPHKRKGDPEPSGSPPPPIHHRHSHSNSGSHLHFHSDSEDEDSEDGDAHLHSGSPSPLHPYAHISYADHEALDNSYPVGGAGDGGFLHMNYMKRQTTPSVVYEQRPISSPTVHMGESSSSEYYPYPYATNQNPSTQFGGKHLGVPYYGYSNYGGVLGGSSSPPPPYGYSSLPQQLEPLTSKAPPPPPSPPRASAWEFLNPFESFDKYYPQPQYTPSRDSREVREEEGIPDLEDEDYQQEVVKEVHVDQKFVDGGGGDREANYSKTMVDDEDGKPSDLPRSSMEPDAVEYEVHVVDKKVVDKEENPKDKASASGYKYRGGFRGDSDVVKEIQVQFERASESGNELAVMLEVGKLPHNRKHTAYQAFKILHVIPPSSVVSSKPSTSQTAATAAFEKADHMDDVVGVGSRNLSSTMQKLYLWEKKLYEEVKAEEKMRVLHERKCQKLKHLDEIGAEQGKVDKTRTLVRSLSTKIRIAIQVVDNISVKINKLRDEELWPQLNKFIQGLTDMWKAMRECHHNQCEAIRDARKLDAIAWHRHSSNTHLDATLQLEHELLNWTLRFSCWVGSQRGYVRALNNWLMKCLLYVPEETSDGIAPFSPGRIGAPPVFIICNQWSQALERISEKEVVDYMRGFATSVLELRERDKQEMQQRMMTNKDIERRVKNLEREDQEFQKKIQALDRMMVLVSGDRSGLSLTGQVADQSDSSKNSGFQASLQNIFEAMERFASNSLGVYNELLQRIEEDNLTREKDKVSQD